MAKKVCQMYLSGDFVTKDMICLLCKSESGEDVEATGDE